MQKDKKNRHKGSHTLCNLFVELFSLQDTHGRVCWWTRLIHPTLTVTRPSVGCNNCAADRFAPISTASGDKPGSMRAVIDPRPILQRRENFRNWFSALRCILLTNNCGQSFSQPPAPPTKTSKVPSNQRALHFALDPLGSWRMKNVCASNINAW